jgi:ADP-ribosylglycohydrolase
MKLMWGTLSETVLIEYAQSADEGRDVKGFRDEAQMIFDMYNLGEAREEDAKKLIDGLRHAPLSSSYPYGEPSTLEDIRAARPQSGHEVKKIDRAAYYDKVYGAWLGRCAGCLLGQPVEGWRSGRINGMLKDTGNYPVRGYFSSDVGEETRKKYSIVDEGHVYGSNKINWINNTSYMPEDDDTNYTILYLKTMEEYGHDFTSDNVAQSWLMNVPFMHVCTAERVAYRNFTNMILPPLSGSWYNAYREWIGAQIRADFFGYVSPGDPAQAAGYAWRDGRVSHVKNGIYGEMLFAAMIGRAAVSSDMDDIIRKGLDEIPEKSRLTEGVKRVIGWRKQGIGWEDALAKIHGLYDERFPHDWCHTISNAMICAVSLLWGENDLEKTIGIAVCAGFDTDCNAATTGSIIGMIQGASDLPKKWTDPLHNKVKSGIDGFGLVEISGLAERTVKLAFGE